MFKECLKYNILKTSIFNTIYHKSLLFMILII